MVWFRGLPYPILLAFMLLLLAACGNAGVAPGAGTSTADTSVADGATPAPDKAASLEGSQWVLTTYGPTDQSIAPPQGAQVTAEFTADQVKGTAACNSYGGSYTVEGGRLAIREVMQTEMACLRDDLMALERAYLQALTAATAYAIEGDTLTIEYPGGVLRFARSMPPAAVPLEDTPWALGGFGNGEAVSSPVAGSRVTADFAAGRVSGSTGCNSYGGSYSVQASRVTFGEIVSTRRASGEEIMAQERAFLEALRTADRIALDGQALRIEHATGTLYFTAAQPDVDAGSTTR